MHTHGSLLPQLNFLQRWGIRRRSRCRFPLPRPGGLCCRQTFFSFRYLCAVVVPRDGTMVAPFFASTDFEAVSHLKMGCRPLVGLKSLGGLRVFVAAEPCEEDVRSAIQRLNGKVLPKLNWSAPKDAQWLLAIEFFSFQLVADR